SSYEAAATLFEFKLTKILIDKMEKRKSFDIVDYKKELYDALVKSYDTDKDIFESYGEDQSISRRKNMFWHNAQDDTMFTSMRCIFRHERTQVYGTILPKELKYQGMLESKAYKTYYAFASGEKTPKPKLKTKAKVAKSYKKKQPAKKPKAKGLAVLSEVALTEAEQLKLATKRSKT
nr:hypothetical protein [Tanacetum cinerariifolium]